MVPNMKLTHEELPGCCQVSIDAECSRAVEATLQAFPLALGSAASASVACYFREFVFPKTPLLPWADAVGFLNNRTRIVAGRLPYPDYFVFLPPGMDFGTPPAMFSVGYKTTTDDELWERYGAKTQ